MAYSTPTKSTKVSYQRLNLTLPLGTVQLLERTVKKGDRSAFIDMAVRSYVASIGRGNLRKRLTEAAYVRSERDQNLVEDWFTLDEELWHKKGV